MNLTKRNRIIKRSIQSFAILFILMNIVAVFHSYKFTHFASSHIEKTKSAEQLSIIGKMSALAFGVNNPRPTNRKEPKTKFETIQLQSNKKIECWFIPCSTVSESANGTIIICHGFSGNKSLMLDKAEIFDTLGFNCLLVDFMGSGGSEGNTTTIGFKEAEQVKTAFDFLQNKGEKNIFLFGTSMGSVAIMKALNDYDIKPQKVILECPFGTMYKTVGARFRNMNIPAFPMADLLVFWGGVQNNFWAFSHNPNTYAKEITVPTLLMYGNKDKTISRLETDEIFKNLNCKKKLKVFDKAGHENYLKEYREEWKTEVNLFLNEP